MQPRVILVLGGAASGKSAFAEEFTKACEKRMTYLATSHVVDDEMRTKIAIHAGRRGPEWTVVEEPLEPGPLLARLGVSDVCLLDCATMWLSNQMMAEADLPQAQDRLLSALADTASTVVIVSNEVGQGIVPDNALARAFREAQGRLNIALARQADLVVQVVAGLPNVLKGTLP